MKHKAQMIFLMATLSILSCKKGRSSTHSDFVSKEECIKGILKQDDSLGKLRNVSCKQVSLSKSIADYTKEIGQFDYSNCPEALSKAFKTHKEAWNEMMVITNKYPDLRGEMHDLFDQIEIGSDSTQFKILLKNIWDTWADVETASK